MKIVSVHPVVHPKSCYANPFDFTLCSLITVFGEMISETCISVRPKNKRFNGKINLFRVEVFDEPVTNHDLTD